MRRGGVKSIVDDFVLGRGVVISRAATSLRSVETQPLTRRFVRIRRTHLRFNQGLGAVAGSAGRDSPGLLIRLSFLRLGMQVRPLPQASNNRQLFDTLFSME